MGTEILIFGGILLGSSIVLMIGIEHLMRRFGIQPARPEERSRGFGDVLQRLSEWKDARDNADRDSTDRTM